MFEEARVITLYAETPLHPGSGSTTGVIDLPVQRERHTGHPLIPGSGIKGVFRDLSEQTGKKKKEKAEQDKWDQSEWDQKIKIVFGPKTGEGDSHGGALAFTDARLLLFPVRSLEGIFVWTTCPFILNRLRRDLQTAKVTSISIPEISVKEGTAQLSGTMKSPLILEEYDFTVVTDYNQDDMNKLVTGLTTFFPRIPPQSPNGPNTSPSQKQEPDPYDSYRTQLCTHLVVLSDRDFNHLVTTATEVVTRIKLTDQKTNDNMWVEEFLPSDCLFYSLALAMPPRTGNNPVVKDAQGVLNFIADDVAPKIIQIGGDETVGRGWMRVSFLNGAKQ